MNDVSHTKQSGDTVTIHGKTRKGHASYREVELIRLNREATLDALLAERKAAGEGKGAL